MNTTVYLDPFTSLTSQPINKLIRISNLNFPPMEFFHTSGVASAKKRNIIKSEPRRF